MHNHSLRSFAHNHDHIPAFHAAYLVLTFLAAALLNMGAFGLLIAAHMSLDIVKYRDIHGKTWAKTIAATFRESLVDVALFFIGLVFAVYLHHTIGLVGLSGIVRSEMTVLRLLGTVLPKIGILEHFLSLMANLHAYLHTPHPLLEKPYSRLERVSLFSAVTSVVLLASASALMNVQVQTVVHIIVEEMTFWHL